MPKQPLSDAIDNYLTHRRSLGIAEGTIKSNHQALRRFLTVTGNILVDNIHEAHVDAYFNSLEGRRSLASQHNDVVALSGFFRWAVRTKRAGRHGNPMADRKAPRTMPREWRGISLSKVPALLDSASHPRDRILLALGVYLVGRSIEFSILRIRDLRLEDEEIAYQIPKTFKVDVMPICRELDEELRRWLTYYTNEQGPLDPNWFLVPAKRKPRLAGDRTVVPGSETLVPWKRVQSQHRIAQEALVSVGYPIRDENGKSRYEGMHTLRRSIARGLYDELEAEGHPNPIELLRALLNHSTEAQTRAYIGKPADKIRRDKRLKGQLMFPSLRSGTVSDLGAARMRREEQAGNGG